MPKKKGKKKKAKRNPGGAAGGGQGLLVVNPGGGGGKKKSKGKYGLKRMVGGFVNINLPIQVVSVVASAIGTRIATAKILGARDQGWKSLAVQSGTSIAMGVAVKALTKKPIYGWLVALGGNIHAVLRYAAYQIGKATKPVPGFEYGDVYIPGPVEVPAPAAPGGGVAGLYVEEEATEELVGVGSAYEGAY